MTALILKRASISRPAGEWNDDDFDVLADGAVAGRIFKANAAPVGSPWMWTLAFGHHEDRRKLTAMPKRTTAVEHGGDSINAEGQPPSRDLWRQPNHEFGSGHAA
jgi:hypothetical protein